MTTTTPFPWATTSSQVFCSESACYSERRCGPSDYQVWCYRSACSSWSESWSSSVGPSIAGGQTGGSSYHCDSQRQKKSNFLVLFNTQSILKFPQLSWRCLFTVGLLYLLFLFKTVFFSFYPHTLELLETLGYLSHILHSAGCFLKCHDWIQFLVGRERTGNCHM